MRGFLRDVINLARAGDLKGAEARVRLRRHLLRDPLLPANHIRHVRAGLSELRVAVHRGTTSATGTVPVFAHPRHPHLGDVGSRSDGAVVKASR